MPQSIILTTIVSPGENSQSGFPDVVLSAAHWLCEHETMQGWQWPGAPQAPQPQETMPDMTNQEVINLFHAEFGDNYWAVLVDAGLGEIVRIRANKYAGPPVENWHLSNTQKQCILDRLNGSM